MSAQHRPSIFMACKRRPVKKYTCCLTGRASLTKMVLEDPPESTTLRRIGMNEQLKQCPECDAPDSVGRRDFLTAVGGTAVALAGFELVPKAVSAQGTTPAAQPARQARPAEALIRELFEGLTDAQKQRVVY